MKRAFIYTRVSTLEQAKEGYSIGEQEHRLKAYAEAKGLEVIKVYSDPGFSGAKMERPALKGMIKDIKSADVVLVYKLDRLSRSQKDTLYLIEEVFLKNDVDFISLNESFDTSTSFGRAMIGILSVFAQLEREQMLERFEMGKIGRVKSGKWYGGGGKGKMIIGYDYVDGKLEVDEYEAACVRLVFSRKLQNYSVSKIWDEVQEKFPGVLRSLTTIADMTKNETYIGKLRWKGEVYDGEHEPIISQDDFYAVNSKAADKAKVKRNARLLSNIAVCGQCGSPIYATGGYKRKDGTSVHYYGCRGRRKYRDRKTYVPECKMKPKRMDAIDAEVIAEIKKIKIEDVFIDKIDSTNSKNINALQEEIKSIDKQVDKLIELFAIDNIDFDNINKRITTLNDKKEKLITNLEQMKDDEPSVEEQIKTISTLSEVDFDKMEMGKKRLIVAKLINKITFYDDYIAIEWAF